MVIYLVHFTDYRFHSHREGQGLWGEGGGQNTQCRHTVYKTRTLLAPHRHENTKHTEREEPLFDFAMAFVGVNFTCECDRSPML